MILGPAYSISHIHITLAENTRYERNFSHNAFPRNFNNKYASNRPLYLSPIQITCSYDNVLIVLPNFIASFHFQSLLVAMMNKGFQNTLSLNMCDTCALTAQLLLYRRNNEDMS